jgi:hypothetical protein
MQPIEIRFDQLRPGSILAACAEHGRAVVAHVRVLEMNHDNPNDSLCRARILEIGKEAEAKNVDRVAHQKVTIEYTATAGNPVQPSDQIINLVADHVRKTARLYGFAPTDKTVRGGVQQSALFLGITLTEEAIVTACNRIMGQC